MRWIVLKFLLENICWKTFCLNLCTYCITSICFSERTCTLTTGTKTKLSWPIAKYNRTTRYLAKQSLMDVNDMIELGHELISHSNQQSQKNFRRPWKRFCYINRTIIMLNTLIDYVTKKPVLKSSYKIYNKDINHIQTISTVRPLKVTIIVCNWASLFWKVWKR